jgi:hypothetical protein
MKSNLQMLSILLPSMLLLGCAATPKSPIYAFKLSNPESNPATNPADLVGNKYFIVNSQVNFSQKLNNPSFYNSAQLNTKFSELLAAALANKNALRSDNNAMGINATFNYKRIYMGEAFGMSKLLGGGNCQVEVSLSKGGLNVAQYNSPPILIGPTAIGLTAALGRAALQATDAASAEDKSLALCVSEVVAALP